MNLVDYRALAVTLKICQFHIFKTGFKPGKIAVERGVAVNTFFSHAQQVEIRAIDYCYLFHIYSLAMHLFSLLGNASPIYHMQI